MTKKKIAFLVDIESASDPYRTGPGEAQIVIASSAAEARRKANHWWRIHFPKGDGRAFKIRRATERTVLL